MTFEVDVDIDDEVALVSVASSSCFLVWLPLLLLASPGTTPTVSTGTSFTCVVSVTVTVTHFLVSRVRLKKKDGQPDRKYPPHQLLTADDAYGTTSTVVAYVNLTRPKKEEENRRQI